VVVVSEPDFSEMLTLLGLRPKSPGEIRVLADSLCNDIERACPSADPLAQRFVHLANVWLDASPRVKECVHTITWLITSVLGEICSVLPWVHGLRSESMDPGYLPVPLFGSNMTLSIRNIADRGQRESPLT
jgi:hypothetical protein